MKLNQMLKAFKVSVFLTLSVWWFVQKLFKSGLIWLNCFSVLCWYTWAERLPNFDRVWYSKKYCKLVAVRSKKLFLQFSYVVPQNPRIAWELYGGSLKERTILEGVSFPVFTCNPTIVFEDLGYKTIPQNSFIAFPL